MKIGFTGTQRGMTREQKDTFLILLNRMVVTEFHHGDCIGADADAHDEVRVWTMAKVVIHPPVYSSKRAFKKGEAVMPVLPYLVRNKNIVKASETMIATPGEVEEQLRSGTWSTIRFARKLRRQLYIIYPNGSVV